MIMKLLIISAVMAVALANVEPQLKIESIVLPEPVIPNVETDYVPRPEPISIGMIMVPQEVLDAVAAQQVEDNVEPVDIENLIVNIVENSDAVDSPAFEPISAGELESIRIAMPEFLEPMDEIEPVKVVDMPAEIVENVQETIVEPVKVAQPPLDEMPLEAIYPHLRYNDPRLR